VEDDRSYGGGDKEKPPGSESDGGSGGAYSLSRQIRDIHRSSNIWYF